MIPRAIYEHLIEAYPASRVSFIQNQEIIWVTHDLNTYKRTTYKVIFDNLKIHVADYNSQTSIVTTIELENPKSLEQLEECTKPWQSLQNS